MKLLNLLPVLFLTACCTFQPQKCKEREICTPKEPIVQYQYNTIPEYLVTPCIRPEVFPLDITGEEFARLLDKRKGDHNLCADRIDTIKLRNDEFVKANETERLNAEEAQKKLDASTPQP